jgi:hypothetical protein
MKDVAIFYHDDGRSITIKPVLSCKDNLIETETELFPVEGSCKFVNSDGGLVYVYGQIDIPAFIEAQNLKKLRRSVALSKLFDYDKEKPINWGSLAMWMLIFALLFFK